MAEKYDFYIKDELFETIEKEFDGETIAKKYAQSKNIKDFEEYGKQLMLRTIELSDQEKYRDRTYQVLLESAKKTGELIFPHVAQRYIEIAYLSVHLMGVVQIEANNAQELSFKVAEEDCKIYQSLKNLISKEELEKLPCQAACLSTLKTVFDKMGFKVETNMLEKMPENGECYFQTLKK
ncbi:MAG: hypothetical protein ACUVXA_11235 [Candidatus Jordarchaeum sp.]|uniref:hypothetical protein n=1 Tax=Candidatus Jordarchaeum sp. TaxID=2823881 RepID=UPI004049629B